MTQQQRLSQVDEDWFWFPGPDDNGCWWEHSFDGNRWIPKINKAQVKLSREEKQELMSQIAKRWSEMKEQNPGSSRRSRTVDLSTELRIPRSRVEFMVKKAGLWGNDPRAKKNRRQPEVVERERLILEIWDSQRPEDFKSRTQRCRAIASAFQTVHQVVWPLLVRTGRIEKRTRRTKQAVDKAVDNK